MAGDKYLPFNFPGSWFGSGYQFVEACADHIDPQALSVYCRTLQLPAW